MQNEACACHTLECPFFKVGKTGKAIGIDHIPELVEESKNNIAKDLVTRALMETDRLVLVVGDGRQGYPQEAPFDAIHVGAAAPSLPEAVSFCKLTSELILFIIEIGYSLVFITGHCFTSS